MEKIVVVDPGKKDAGVAVFTKGKLTDCWLISGNNPIALAHSIYKTAGDVDHVVVEDQQIYNRGGGNPNDLIPLAQCVGAVIALFGRPYTIIKPREWTKGVPKAPRQAAFLLTLDKHEVDMINGSCRAKALRHNVVDAVALGYYYLKK